MSQETPSGKLESPSDKIDKLEDALLYKVEVWIGDSKAPRHFEGRGEDIKEKIGQANGDNLPISRVKVQNW